MPAIEVALQITIGIVIGLVIYTMAYLAMKTDIDKMNASFNPSAKLRVDVFKGYYDSSSLVQKVYNANNPIASNYKAIVPSSNLKGGAQFTYSMWMFVGEPGAALEKCIFLHGDPRKYPFTVTDNVNKVTRSMNEFVAFCPMMSFGAGPLDFVVSFNTMNNMRETLNIKSTKSDDTNYRKNMLSLFGNSWFCVTLVFEDNMPINDFENGVVVKFYLNDTLYITGKYASALKQNSGDLVFFPDSSGVSSFKMSNFTYYNYALSESDIKTIVSKGPNTNPVVDSSQSITLPYYISEYNKIDLANT